MEAGIKNDDNLVKLATIYQRIMSKAPVDGGDVTLLSEEEKEELMASLEDVANDLNKKVDIKSSISKTAN